MKTMNKAFAILVLVVCIFSSCVVSAEVAPCADDYFVFASAYLASNKTVTFDFLLYGVFDKISVSSVWLEQQVDGEWEYVKNLTAPSYVALNMASYGAEVSYSSDIGTGTFRVGFNATADGYTITRYSNSRTF